MLDVQLLRKIFGSVEEAAKYSPVPRLSEDIGHESRPSPDLKPEPMPVSSPRVYISSPLFGRLII